MLKPVVITLLVVLSISFDTVHSSYCQGRPRICKNAIIDIKLSKDLGAKLLRGLKVDEYRSCMEQCCQEESCDLAIYRKEGLSQIGHNCYFVSCGKYSNCQLIGHSNFRAVFFEHGVNRRYYDNDLYLCNEDDYSTTTSHNSPQTDAPSHGNTSFNNGREHEMVNNGKTSDDSITTTLTINPITSSGTRFTVSLFPNGTSPTALPTGTLSTSTGIVSSSTGIVSSSSTASTSISTTVQSSTLQNNILKPTATVDKNIDDDVLISDDGLCQFNSCNNRQSTLIVVCIASGVLVIAVMIVTALVLRKLLNNRKRQYYHNVDYLINGMYS